MENLSQPVETVENSPLILVRPHLNDLPTYLLPEGFTLRFLRTAGDADVWLTVVRAAEIWQRVSDRAFFQAYGDNAGEIHRRVYFLETEDGQIIGTVGAWLGRDDWAGWGRIHWLYLLPSHQGRGLGKVLLAFALRRLRELGHGNAYLKTSTGRTEALGLYTAFGFKARTSAS